MMDFADRIVRAPDNDARAREIVNLAPDATLARYGLMHRPSMITTTLAFTGAVAIGAFIGAGAALLFTPMTGKDVQEKLRTQAKRLSREAKNAADRVESSVANIRDQVTDASEGDATSPDRRHGARA
jgi:hypothetical protein